MTKRKPQGAFYERAPNILIEKIAELSAVLMNYRHNGHSEEVLKFYDEVLDAMKLAHLYMEQTKFIHHRNALLESNYRLSKAYLLNQYVGLVRITEHKK